MFYNPYDILIFHNMLYSFKETSPFMAIDTNHHEKEIINQYLNKKNEYPFVFYEIDTLLKMLIMHVARTGFGLLDLQFLKIS